MACPATGKDSLYALGQECSNPFFALLIQLAITQNAIQQMVDHPQAPLAV